MRRAVDATGSRVDVSTVVDYPCSVARLQSIFYLWRPMLKDPAGEMVLEVAAASGATAIITLNSRAFAGVERVGVEVWSPGELLRRCGGER